jgi:hypothetical protein
MSESSGLLGTYKEWEQLKKAHPELTYCPADDFLGHPISEAAAAASAKIFHDMVSQAMNVYDLPRGAQRYVNHVMCASEGAGQSTSSEVEQRGEAEEVDEETADTLNRTVTTEEGSVKGERTVDGDVVGQKEGEERSKEEGSELDGREHEDMEAEAGRNDRTVAE